MGCSASLTRMQPDTSSPGSDVRVEERFKVALRAPAVSPRRLLSHLGVECRFGTILVRRSPTKERVFEVSEVLGCRLNGFPMFLQFVGCEHAHMRITL